ncbi:MAG: PIN domain-containing protein [Candidatus Omnitrophota bacterium]|jgi:predicted nucleic acid-binding protein|nr:MAG: PIN domain-containing protein [Candidatus Omnitrophota bacterium]
MREFVLDCSATMAYFFKDETSACVDAAFEMLVVKGTALVPPIWPLEVANTCLSAERRKRLTIPDVEEIFSILEMLPIEIIPYEDLKSTWDVQSMARTHNLTAYDAAYLELAKRKNLPLLTLDKKLKQSTEKAGVSLWTPASD